MTPEALKELEDRLWKSADDLRANSDLASHEYSTPVLGLIFLKFADNKYSAWEEEIRAEFRKLKGTRRTKPLAAIAIEKCGFYLPESARYQYLLSLPEKEDIAEKIKQAMQQVEKYKSELKGILPQEEYFALTRTDSTIPNRLLRNFSDIPKEADGDLFGHIYEYFLAKFALAEGQGGGEFFTPRSVVRLMVEMIQPHGGTVFDPACGSGGMFVQSARFVEEHRRALKENGGDLDLYVSGQEKTLQTVKLAKMNLAVNGLRGDIRQANSYYEDPFKSLGHFDYVLANPPFNVDDVNLKRVEDDPRLNAYGIPRRKTKTKGKAEDETVPNANYLWINLFASSLKETGRAALVMANSASDARHSEADIRRNLIEKNLIYGMLTLPSNMFYTVTLPATLWFFDKAKGKRGLDTDVLFINARNVFTQIDRAHREFSEAQIQNLAVIGRLHRGDRRALVDLVDEYFKDGMKALAKNAEKAPKVAEQARKLIDDTDCRKAVKQLAQHWQKYKDLQAAWGQYRKGGGKAKDVDKRNRAQHKLAKPFGEFFAKLHTRLKALDKTIRAWEAAVGVTAKAGTQSTYKRGRGDKKTNELKIALDALHGEVKDAERYFQHIRWLQERFPEAQYEDVTGLCKLASKEELKEQDWSLNPGRYVGVVIEEDGKSDVEFASELTQLKDDLTVLSKSAKRLHAVIDTNLSKVLGQ